MIEEESTPANTTNEAPEELAETQETAEEQTKENEATTDTETPIKSSTKPQNGVPNNQILILSTLFSAFTKQITNKTHF